MGRTLPSAMEVFDRELANWSKFRRALRREDQQLFDELFLQARRHIAAMAYFASPVPMESFFLAMFLEERRAVKSLEQRISRLEGKPDENSNRMDT